MSAATSITRDRFTWLTYLMLGCYSYLLNGMGPIIPFLRAELQMSYTLSSLHSSAFAVGMLLAGVLADRCIGRFGRRTVFWGAAFGMSGSALLFILVPHPAFTITSALLIGTIGSFLLVIIPSTLSERYGNLRAVALSEANVAASLSGACAPMVVSLFVKLHLGWRGALVAMLFVVALLWMIFKNARFPEAALAAKEQSSKRPKLPRRYWAWWSVLVLGVAVEFCIIFWCATFLEVERGLPRATAAFSVSIFLAAMVIGRLGGSMLSHRFSSHQILLGSVIVSLFGFALHWGSHVLGLVLFGLFLAGVGVANLYPQLLSLAVGSAGALTDMASARASLASGTAILSLPLLLGAFADFFGLGRAYAIVIVLLVLVGIGTVAIYGMPLVKKEHLS